MLDKNSLKDILHQQGLTKTDKLILCLAVDHENPKSVKEILEIARAGGLGAGQFTNISALLSASGGKAVHTGNGWELTSDGLAHANKLTSHLPQTAPPKVATNLRSDLKKIKDPQTASFVEEAIRCFESRLYRAAVVLSWVGAVSVLYQHVIKHRLIDFNAAAYKRFPKWKDAKISDDLALMQEKDFLQVLQDISVIGKSVRQELEKRLELRNGCGHPSSLVVGENTVSAHIEALILNVFSKFSV